MFIIDFLVTLPIALYVFLLFPDTPETTKAFYLTQDERELSVSRLRRDHSTEHVHGEVNKQLFKRLLTTWELYAVSSKWLSLLAKRTHLTDTTTQTVLLHMDHGCQL